MLISPVDLKQHIKWLNMFFLQRFNESNFYSTVKELNLFQNSRQLKEDSEWG